MNLSTRAIFLILLGVFGSINSYSQNLTFDYQIELDQKEKEYFESFIKEEIQHIFNHSFSNSNFADLKKQNITVSVATGNVRDGASYVDDKGKLILQLSSKVINHSSLKRLLAHELFHLIHYKLKPNELNWVKEGLASYFEYRVYGKLHLATTIAALKTSTTPLEGEYSLVNPDLEQYGHNQLFFYYLINQCDNDDLFIKLLLSKSNGREGVDQALASNNSDIKYCSSFSKIAAQFTKARVINKLSDYGRSKDLYLISNRQELPVNDFLAEKLSQMNDQVLLSFFKKLPSFLPLILPITAKDLMKRIASMKVKGLKINSAKRSFPASIEPYDSLGSDSKAEFYLLFKAL